MSYRRELTGFILAHVFYRRSTGAHPGIGQLFEQYISNMNVDISVLNDLPLLMNPNTTD